MRGVSVDDVKSPSSKKKEDVLSSIITEKSVIGMHEGLLIRRDSQRGMCVDGEEVMVYFLDKKSERVELKISSDLAVYTLKTKIAALLKVGVSEIKIFINGLLFDDLTPLAGIHNLEGSLILIKKEEKEETAVDKDEDPGQDPVLRAADMRNILFLGGETEPSTELLSLIKEHNMKYMYESAWEQCDWKLDQELVAQMSKVIAIKHEEFKIALETAQENAGEVEVQKVRTQIAEYAMLTASPEETAKKWKEVQGKKKKGASTTQKINLSYNILKIFLAYNRMDLFREELSKAKELVELGGDWTALNILQIFEGLGEMRDRKFEKAADLFIRSIATYTATDLMSYDKFLQYTILCSCLSKDRKTLKEKILDSSDVKGVDIPLMKEFVACLVNCNYIDYFPLLIRVMDFMKKDLLLHEHVYTYFRAMRLRGYMQYFVVYKTSTLAQLAEVFGVSLEFVDRDIADFIYNGKLQGKINKVEGVVVSERGDPVNDEYHKIIKLGDNLLNKISRLSHLIS